MIHKDYWNCREILIADETKKLKEFVEEEIGMSPSLECCVQITLAIIHKALEGQEELTINVPGKEIKLTMSVEEKNESAQK